MGTIAVFILGAIVGLILLPVLLVQACG